MQLFILSVVTLFFVLQLSLHLDEMLTLFNKSNYKCENNILIL